VPLCRRTLSLKTVRRLLEKDLGLEKKSLDAQRDIIGSLVDKVCSGAQLHPPGQQQHGKQETLWGGAGALSDCQPAVGSFNCGVGYG
jgi:hypothetical protein